MTTLETILANIAIGAPELTSSSNAAIYRKVAEAIALSLDSTLAELNNTKNIIDYNILNTRWGKLLYYEQKAKSFQYGDALSIDAVTLEPYYTVIDETKLIIQQASAQLDTSGIIVLKLATLDTTTGKLIALTPTQLSAFNTYFLNFEVPGLPITKVSLDANILEFAPVITYYGGYDLTTLKSNVIGSLETFKNTYSFNGKFFTNDLETYIKNNVAGVRNFQAGSASIDAVSIVNGSSDLTAGYFEYSAGTLLSANLDANYVTV
jgi:hypothetical protein